jgi:UDP-N-acetylglucosamine--dolichyl-phosphate N-acetylglucosaminephosphotransferase
MTYVPFLAAVLSFIITYIATNWLIRYLKRIGLVVKDMNKKNTPLIPISGGLAALAGIFIGLMFYIFFQTFYFKYTNTLLYIFAGLTSLIMITFVGFVDDILIKKNKESSSGLKQWQKPLLTLSAAVPLMVVNAGVTTLWLPVFGRTDLGLIYPLIFIPIGVIGAANMVNMLAGFNGIEVGMGIIYTGMLGLYSFINNREVAAVIALITLASLIAFYFYNKYPAKILPGDSLTYLLGGVIAVIAIIGNIEKAAIIASIPFFIEFVLKLRSKFKAKSYGYYKNGKIMSYYNSKIYSIPHLFTRTGRYTEKQIFWFMILIELIFSSLIWVI